MEIMYSGQQITVGNRPNVSHSFPDNWQLCSLGEITTSSQYGISSSSGGNYSVPILKMNNLQDGHIDLGDLDYIQLSKAEMESLMLNKGDLLINRTNSLDLVGKAAIYDLAGEHVFASYLVRFRLGPSVLPAFVNYFLNSEPGQRKLKLLATKAVSQANINPSILKRRLFVPIPPILEQHRIVEILYAWDHSINLTTQLIAKKRNIKRAVMQQLLTGKKRLPGFGRELKAGYKQTEVGLIPEDWEVTKLGEVADVKTGPFGSALHEKDYVDDGTPIITVEHLGEQGVVYVNLPMVSDLDRKRLKAYSLLKGDIVLSRVGSVDRNSLIKEEESGWLFSGRLLRIRLKTSDIYSPFLSYYFNQEHTKQRIRTVAVGQTMASLNTQILRNIDIAFPPTKSEQTAIASVLSDMDAEIISLEQKRDKTRALKQGMMQELLTGKTRLV